MFEGGTRDALRLLYQAKLNSKPLPLDSIIEHSDGSTCTTRDVLVDKHPSPGPLSCDHIQLKSTPKQDHEPHFAVFDQLDGSIVKQSVKQVLGAAGPSGTDALFWKTVCTFFYCSADDLCLALAALARKLCTTYIDHASLSPFVACRLIALDKQPGM
jgi:hypothetical protein